MRNKLSRIEEMLKEKSKLVSDLDEKIVSVCKVEEIEKEIDEAETLKMSVMDALANISLTTTPSNTSTTYTTNVESTAQFSEGNPSVPTGSLATPPSTQALQTTGSPPSSSALPSRIKLPNRVVHLLQQIHRHLNYQSSPYRNLEAK